MDKSINRSFFSNSNKNQKNSKNKEIREEIEEEKIISMSDQKKESDLSSLDKATQLLKEFEKKKFAFDLQLEELLKLTGISREIIQDYFNILPNYSIEEQEEIQKGREEFLSSLDLPPSFNEVKSIFLAETSKPLSFSGSSKKRKTNIASSRRRGWLPMR